MRRPAVIHPILFALYPILFLYAHNLKEMAANQIFMVLGISLGLALLAWFLFGLLLKNWAKAGLATSLLALLFFTYGHFYSLLERVGGFVPGHGYLLPGTLLAFGYAVYFIHRAKRDFRITTRVLNIAITVMLSMSTFSIVSYQFGAAQTASRQPVAREAATTAPAESMPDIYFIVLDEYAHPETMKQTSGYDSSQFLESLQAKGFYIASGSTMHNKETIRAIASILNMKATPEDEPTEVTHSRITDNAVVRYLRSIGYNYVYFGQWYEEGRYQVNADSYNNYYLTAGASSMTAEFSKTLWNTTMLRPFQNYLTGERYEGYYREGLLKTLEHLKRVPDMPGPKFVFAHIMAPHTPFVFGANGERVAPANFYNVSVDDYYLGQYQFISRQIDAVLGEILERSTKDPIIIVQSDHGPRWLDTWENVFNAYHLPGSGSEMLYDDISPVDSFRLIIDHYFKGAFEDAEEMAIDEVGEYDD